MPKRVLSEGAKEVIKTGGSSPIHMKGRRQLEPPSHDALNGPDAYSRRCILQIFPTCIADPRIVVLLVQRLRKPFNPLRWVPGLRVCSMGSISGGMSWMGSNHPRMTTFIYYGRTVHSPIGCPCRVCLISNPWSWFQIWTFPPQPAFLMRIYHMWGRCVIASTHCSPHGGYMARNAGNNVWLSFLPYQLSPLILRQCRMLYVPSPWLNLKVLIWCLVLQMDVAFGAEADYRTRTRGSPAGRTTYRGADRTLSQRQMLFWNDTPQTKIVVIINTHCLWKWSPLSIPGDNAKSYEACSLLEVSAIWPMRWSLLTLSSNRSSRLQFHMRFSNIYLIHQHPTT